MSEELTEEQLFEILEPYLESGELDGLDVCELEGTTFLIFDEWDTVEFVQGLVNGFVGAVYEPYIPSGTTIPEAIVELEKETVRSFNKGESKWQRSRIQEKIKKLRTCILYKQHIATLDDIQDIGDVVEWGFQDEYSRCACGNCGNAVRTSPDSYSWTPPLFIDCEGYIADECVEDGSFDDEILEEYANVAKSIPDIRTPEDLGLVQINEDSLANGWYGGQTDEPGPIIEALNAESIEVWFKVFPQQFCVHFDVYVKAEDLELAKMVFAVTDTEADEDPAVAMERGLKAATEAMSSLQGEGIKHATVNSDGTATVKLVSPEDFINGSD